MAKKQKDLQLDEYEQEWLNALRAGKLKPRKKSTEAKMLVKASENFQKKNARANIRIAQWVLNELKFQASRLGIPYQTYMSSVLYKQAEAGRITPA